MNNAARSLAATAVFVLTATAAQLAVCRPAAAAAIANVGTVGAHLRQATSVPVLLPSSLPDSIVGGGGLRMLETSASPSGYEAAIVAGKRCTTAFCRIGFMRGLRSPGGAPTGTIVRYGGSHVAYYATASCVGGCKPSTLTWDAGGFRYVLGIRGGGLNALRFTAVSVTRY